jgi:type IV secretory pathway VirB4 component
MAAEGTAVLRPALPDAKPIGRPGRHGHGGRDRGRDRQASSQLVAYGYYTPVIVLFDETARNSRKGRAVRRLIQAEGFGARIETLNATDAFLGSLPGNWYCNIREPLINTRNLADLIPLNSVWSGSPLAPCPFYPADSPPLMQVASGSTLPAEPACR